MNAAHTPRLMQRRHIRWTWIFIPIAVTTVFALGLVGFAEYFRQSESPKSLADLFYLTGQLFTAESGAVDGQVPLKLEIARFAAPLVAAYAVISAVLALFSIEFRRWGLRLRRGHTIVCGLGRKGSHLVEELRKEGRRVVVIEPDEHNPGLPRCRELNVIVIPGRSDDAWTLLRAHIDRADMLIATAGEDSVNIETVVRAHTFTKNRTAGRLQCVAHVTDPGLLHLLKSHAIFGDNRDPFDLELVNVYEAGARAMLELSGLPNWEGGGAHSRRICILGLGHFGEAVLRRLLRDWALHHPPQPEQGASIDGPSPSLEIVIIDLDAVGKENSVRQRFREFLGNVRLHFVARDVRSPDFAGTDLAVSQPGQRLDTFFVCFDDDSLATLAAIRISDRFGADVPIVVRMSEQTGFASLLQCGPAGCSALGGIRTIGFMDIACMRDLFLGGDTEILSRAFHEAYVEERRADGDSPETNPAVATWHALPDSLRKNNRDRASDARHQLGRIGYALVPCPDRPVTLRTFTEEEIDILAEAEHARWLASKRDEGWRFAPKRDNAQRLNPNLIEWPVLPEAEKEFNRTAIRRMPAILARADFEIREVARPTVHA